MPHFMSANTVSMYIQRGICDGSRFFYYHLTKYKIPNHIFINFSDLKMDVRKTLCVLSRTRPQYLLQWNQLQSVIQSSAILLIVFLSLCEALISDDLIVETTKGKIRGVTLKSATNKQDTFLTLYFLNKLVAISKNFLTDKEHHAALLQHVVLQ